MPVKPIPDGYTSVTPHLVVKDAAKAIDFYTRAFGAQELFRLPMPGGGVAHAEIQIGNSRIMLGEEMPEMGYRSPQALGGTPLGLMLYVENVNEAFPRALKAGAKELRPLKDEFWGDRAGTLLDPFGHRWMIATHTRDVSEAEMQKAMASMSAGG